MLLGVQVQKKIVSFDYDPESVATTQYLKKLAGNPDNWDVLQGSILESDFLNSLGQFDIVYSWGVLHHTGDMWQAIRNAAKALAENSIFFIALYSDTTYRDGALEGHPTPEEWLILKQKYLKSSSFQKKILEYKYIHRICTPGKSWLRHPKASFKALLTTFNINEEAQGRGMDFLTDVRDWLGGWPMEFVKERDFTTVCMNELGLRPLYIKTGEANTEFIFCKKNAKTYFDNILENYVAKDFPTPFVHDKGYMWKVSLPELESQVNDQAHPKRSTLTIFEDGIPLGYRHASKEGTILFGEGRYLHQNEHVYFSTPDGSDPCINGRKYTYTI